MDPGLLTYICQSWLVRLLFHSAGPHRHHSPDRPRSSAPACEESGGEKNKEETLSFSLAISLFHQGCQLSPPAVPASYLSIISTWQIHFTMTSPSPYISFFLFFFLTSQLSSPLTGCLFLHKHEFAPLPTKMWFLKWILMVKKRQAWWREEKKKPKATVTDPQTLSCIGL